jgi:hypothetical protein
VHVTTGLTPFFANHGYHQDMHVKLPKEASLPERTADKRRGKLQAARDRPRGSILEAQARKTKYAGGKEMFGGWRQGVASTYTERPNGEA